MSVSYSTRGLGMSWLPNRGDEYFPNPWMDYTSTVMPETIEEALEWCQYIVLNNGIYRSALQRVLSYFITEVEIEDDDVGDDEKDKYREFLEETLDVKKFLFDVGMDYMTYGNAFISLLIPFDRYLYCPKCFTEHPLRVVMNYPDFNFKWQNYEFNAFCQGKHSDGSKCNYRGRFKRIDRRSTDETRLKVKLWSPREIKIKNDELTGECRYIWKIPETYRNQVRKGYEHILENAHWDIIKAIKNNGDLEFAPDFIYHLKDTPLSGHKMMGWGESRILANFRQAWYVQILHKYNEAIGMDYVIPFRVITPVPGRSANPEGADPLLNINLGGFMTRVRQMLRQRRRNPTEWFTLPFPVQYQALGGEATNLAPYELLDQGVGLLLNNIGVPAEMYKGNLQIQSAPAALRLFESLWTHLVHGFNTVLRVICEKVADALSWEKVRPKLVRVTIVDDLQDSMAKLQLMMGRQISQTSGLKPLGMEFKDEQRRILEEEKYIQEQQARLQEEMNQAASMEQLAPPGGAMMAQQGQMGDPNAAMAGNGGSVSPVGQQPQGPAGMAAQGVTASLPTTPNASITPQDLLQKAQITAEKLLGMTASQRHSEMVELKRSDPNLHAIVKQMIEDIRQEAKTQGGAQLLQSQFGGT